MAEAVLESWTGGRYYERGVDGSECEWGQVLARDPPHRIVVAWQITAHPDAWVYDPDLSRASEFEVNFREQPDGQTLVELEHRNIGLGWPGRRRDSPGCQRPRRLARHPGQVRHGRDGSMRPSARTMLFARAGWSGRALVGRVRNGC